ncbi:MAG: DUF4352 domain-containing protein [Calditrichales bacterium]|nr:MAG: DUF4352 domain-containing protein [Calditrichales bacterium]
MKLLKTFSRILLLFAWAIALVSCGGDTSADADKAFQSANYNLAVKHFLEARNDDPANKSMYDEKIALSYMLRGEQLFERSKNIKSFSGNFEKGLEYIPENPSADFQKEYSKILTRLASAYSETKPDNEIQKEEFLNKAITYLEDALVNDDTNPEADAALTKIKSDNFQKMLDKGKNFFSKAGKGGNEDFFISAEYYFRRAAYFDIHNKEALNLLSKTREKTLSLLDNREDFAMAIADLSRQANDIILDLRVKNYATKPVAVDIKNFEIVDVDGKSYPLNQAMMDSKFAKNEMKNQTIDELKFADGILVFSVPKNIKIEYLGYNRDHEVVKKYFP